MTDPFLFDAMEGYESVEGNHIETVFRLQQKIHKQTKRKNRTRIWWAAACAILVIGISVYVFFPEQKDMLVSQKLQSKESKSDVSEAEFEAYDERLSDMELPEKSEQSEIPPLEAPVVAAGKDERGIVHEVHADRSISAKLVADESESPKSSVPTIGMKEYTEYLNKNAVQPTDKECAKAKGKVKLSFYINASGRPCNIKVEKSLCPSCDQKAIELIETGVDWTYGDKIVNIDVTFKGK